jgi:uncharacterized protein (DUF2252 family)
MCDAPITYVCGDLHLENFGSFKGDNGLVYFDLNDFDDALVAPLTVDVVRMLSSVLVAAGQLGLSEAGAMRACEAMLSTYAAVLQTGKPRWLERATAVGMVATLLRRVKGRKRGALLAELTTVRKGKRRLVCNSRHALPADKPVRERARAILAAYSKQGHHGHRLALDDAARRVAGIGSLGLERYMVLARDELSGMQRLVDIKRAAPSPWQDLPSLSLPPWGSDARRVAAVQQVMQAASPALLSAVDMGKASYLVKSLQPTADRVDLAHCSNFAALRELLGTMAHAAAWAHLRGCGHQAADRIEQLQAFAGGTRWRTGVLRLARHGCAVSVAQWKAYADDYREARGG